MALLLCGSQIYIFLADIPPQFAKWQLPPSTTVLEIRIRWMGALPLLPSFSCIFQAWGNFCAAIFFKISQMRSLRRPCFFAPPAVSDRIKDLGNVITSCDTRAPLHCVNKSSCEGGCATKRTNSTSHLDIWNQASWRTIVYFLAYQKKPWIIW